MLQPVRLAVLASGGGTNLQSLIDRFNDDPAAVARVVLVVGSRAGIGALDRARAAGIEAITINSADEDEVHGQSLLATLQESGVEMVVLAGYLKLVPTKVVDRYRGRMLNIHPALLPAFGGPGMYGLRVHRAVLAAGARISGATVHLVDERYDEGAIVAQWPVPVMPADTPEKLAARVLAAEHVLLPAAVEAVARTLRGAPAGQAGTDPAEPIGFDLVTAPAPSSRSVRRLL